MVLFSLHNPGQRWLLPVLEYTGYRLLINIPAAVEDHGSVYANVMLGALYMAKASVFLFNRFTCNHAPSWLSVQLLYVTRECKLYIRGTDIFNWEGV